jgi:sn-glycerol 3-phosphate transport system ATP-binding protein
MGRAIVREPAVFLFDEPLSNLDAKLRVQMRFEIQKLHRRLRTTSLYVTHDQVEAMTLADRMIVMNAGRAEQVGTPMQVYEDPQTVFVAGFIGSPSMNFLPGKGGAHGAIVLDGGGTLQGAVPVAQGRAVTVGVRPEHTIAAMLETTALAGTVEMVEHLGADALVHVGYGGSTFVARVPNGAQPEVGAAFGVRVEPAHVFVFDAASGQRIRAESPVAVPA